MVLSGTEDAKRPFFLPEGKESDDISCVLPSLFREKVSLHIFFLQALDFHFPQL